MNFKRLITNLLILFFSVSLGVIISELVGRKIGLGNPLLYEEDALVGYRLRPNQQKRRLKNSLVSVDYEGFRFDPNQVKNLSAETIVFVGDSVTYGGSYIDDSDLFSSIFCEDKPNLICLNSGVNAWGTYNMGRFISNFSIYSSRIPSTFILVILPSDDQRNLTMLRGLPYWTESPKQPKAINELLNYAVSKYFIPSLRTKDFLYKKDQTKEATIQAQTIKHSWQDLNNYIKSSSSKVAILVTPPKIWLDKPKDSQLNIELYDKYLSAISKNKNVSKTCNLYYLAKSNYSSTDYVDLAHLSKSGHKKWAKYINSCLSQ